MRDSEILHEEICRRMDRIIAILAAQSEHHWYCACGHWNGANLPNCAQCNRTPNESFPCKEDV
jgi:hypothetical protein